MNTRTVIFLLTLMLCPRHSALAEIVPDDLRELSDNGGWCWFQGERAILLEDMLVVGAVADDSGDGGEDRQGDIDVIVHNTENNETSIVTIDENYEDDDHDVPAFYRRDDGRLLAMWSKHSSERENRYRITEGIDPRKWGPLTIISYVLFTVGRITFLSTETFPTSKSLLTGNGIFFDAHVLEPKCFDFVKVRNHI